MSLRSHYMACVAAKAQIVQDPTIVPLVINQHFRSIIVFRRASKDVGFDLTGFEWYCRADQVGWAIKSAFADIPSVTNYCKLMGLYDLKIENAEGQVSAPVVVATDDTLDFSYTLDVTNRVETTFKDPPTKQKLDEIDKYAKAFTEANFLSQLINLTFPAAKAAVGAKLVLFR